ncbi:MAG: hypothetical protein ABL962_19770, partial [Fimbriimonadaceae bacterium]
SSHPACRCTTVPVLAVGDRNIGTGLEWFDRQTQEAKLSVLHGSHRRLEMINSGRATLADMVQPTFSERWGNGLRLKPLSEMGV